MYNKTIRENNCFKETRNMDNVTACTTSAVDYYFLLNTLTSVNYTPFIVVHISYTIMTSDLSKEKK